MHIFLIALYQLLESDLYKRHPITLQLTVSMLVLYVSLSTLSLQGSM